MGGLDSYKKTADTRRFFSSRRWPALTREDADDDQHGENANQVDPALALKGDDLLTHFLTPSLPKSLDDNLASFHARFLLKCSIYERIAMLSWGIKDFSAAQHLFCTAL